MLNNFKEPCVIVMDNAPYHSVLSINYSKSNAVKSSVQQWLRENKVDFCPLETLSKLHGRVKCLIPKAKIYELNEVTLGPYGCTFATIPLSIQLY